MLIPNVREIERCLGEFADALQADEILLFERATFLVIAHAERRAHRDVHRFEKISNIIKQFKLSCTKLASQFQVSDRIRLKTEVNSTKSKQFNSMAAGAARF